MKKKVIVRGPALSQSGYGHQTRFALRSLRSQSDFFDIFIINVPWGQTSWLWEDTEERRWIDERLALTALALQQNPNFQFDLSLQVTIPNEWEKLAPINIGYTAGIETTHVAPGWVDKSYLMDRIITPSQHSMDVYKQSSFKLKHPQTGEDFLAKVKCPIQAVNFPFYECEPNRDFDLNLVHDFNFLTVAQWSPRKNLENTIMWFLEEFKDENVGLVVKASLKNNCFVDDHYSVERLKGLVDRFRTDEHKCKVYLLHGYLSDSEMSALYSHPKIKALVSFSHGEGYGLPLFEAAGYGLPVITTRWSGPIDFLRVNVEKKNGKRKLKSLFTEVDFGLANIQPEAVWNGVLEATSKWAFPLKNSAQSSMRSVYENYSVAEIQANRLKEIIRSDWTPENQYEEFLEAMGFEKEEFEWMNELSQIEIL